MEVSEKLQVSMTNYLSYAPMHINIIVSSLSGAFSLQHSSCVKQRIDTEG
jgi:hypothetical protein